MSCKIVYINKFIKHILNEVNYLESTFNLRLILASKCNINVQKPFKNRKIFLLYEHLFTTNIFQVQY